MDGISRSRGWDKEIPHGVLPMEQLFLSDKWARKTNPDIVVLMLYLSQCFSHVVSIFCFLGLNKY